MAHGNNNATTKAQNELTLIFYPLVHSQWLQIQLTSYFDINARVGGGRDDSYKGFKYYYVILLSLK